MTLLNDLENKKVLILGLGREGMSTFRFLRRRFPNKIMSLADKRSMNQLEEQTKQVFEHDEKVIPFLDNGYLKDISQYDFIFKSSGIPPLTPELVIAKNRGVSIVSNTGLFFETCPNDIIGVTGTKGKSTTSSLIYEALKMGKIDARLTGNIGIAPLSSMEESSSATVFVAEMSSFQLMGLHKSPHIAVLLNVLPEHIDYHGTFEDYVEAKRTIVKYQTEKDYVIYDASNSISAEIANQSKAKKVPFGFGFRETGDMGCFPEDDFLVLRSNGQREKIMPIPSIPLKGRFNLQNVMPAVIIGKLLDIPSRMITKAIRNFKSLEYRLEYSGYYRGISFYNDSLSTIPEAAMAAISAFSDKKIILLAGGFDRGQEFSELARNIVDGGVKGLILFPTTGERLWEKVVNYAKEKSILPKHEFVGNMKEAVQKAYGLASAGDVILLSPASASFGVFEDYRDRGNQFKAEVRRLTA